MAISATNHMADDAPNPFATAAPLPPSEWRKRGRKRKIEREPVHQPVRKLDPKYANLDEDDDDGDRLRINKDEIPDGMDYQWVTDSILGQPAPQRRARFERRGWSPVPANRHDGKFMPRGFQGEINVDGLVLMERPLEISVRARQKGYVTARDQVRAKEAQLTGGDIPGVTLDTHHESAVRKNKVNKSYEQYTPSDRD